MSEEEAYNELCAYTLAHGGPEFIHQYVVDAHTAQHADEKTKPIAITFALVGLYLHLERGFNGREVQLAHMKLTRRKETWPQFVLPAHRGSMTAMDVLAVAPGPDRDRAIDQWCASVWSMFVSSRDAVADLLTRRGIV